MTRTPHIPHRVLAFDPLHVVCSRAWGYPGKGAPVGDTSSWLKVSGNTITLEGNLGTDEITPFQNALADMKFQGFKEIVLDMVNVEYMSSSHLGVIAGAASDAHRRDCAIRIVASGAVTRLLKDTGVDKIVTLEGSDT
jgi:anti-anti-sigma factor